MMAGKIVEILHQVPRRDIMVIGGTAQNDVVMDHLRREIQNLRVPEEAPYFEALGAALWALENETARCRPQEGSSATTRAPSQPCSPWATLSTGWSSSLRGGAKRGQGSGSSSARRGLDNDEGHPDARHRPCRRGLRLSADGRRPGAGLARVLPGPDRSLGPLAEQVQIEGLGVTGSGRQIAGLHAMTEGIINEIAAHAAAAVFFDPDVDTIFEIGGQDANTPTSPTVCPRTMP